METRLVNTKPNGRVHLSLNECVWLQAKVDNTHGGKLPSYYVTVAKRDVPSSKQPCSYCANACGVVSMKVEGVVPILNVSDVEESIAWFAKLGWTRRFTWDAEDPAAPPDFGGVSCDGHEIFLCRDGQGSRGRGQNRVTGGPGANQRADKGAWISVWVDDVDVVHQRCRAEHLDVTYAPTDEPWGVREMHVRHPDGHVLRIGRSRVRHSTT